jgi:hypothetical protein
LIKKLVFIFLIIFIISQILGAKEESDMDLQKAYEGILSSESNWRETLSNYNFIFNCEDILNMTWDGCVFKYKNIVLRNERNDEWLVTISEQNSYELKIFTVGFKWDGDFQYLNCNFKVIGLHSLY